MQAGDKITGGFEIVRELGRGGTATTYLARHGHAGRLVAVKLLHPWPYRRRHAIERLRREARALARIRHPNVVELYEYREDGGHLLVEEYIEGAPLSAFLQAGRPPLVLSIRWMVQALEGLHAAHRSRVLHRDVKPSNLVIRTRDNVCKLIDFGFCKGEALDGFSTTEGKRVGVAFYSSPEQLGGVRQLTPASDVYSLAVILYECLTASRWLGMRGDEPVLVGCQAPATARLERILRRALQRRPIDRYQTAAAFARDLDLYLVEELQVDGAGLADIPSVEVPIEGSPAPKGRFGMFAGAVAACACGVLAGLCLAEGPLTRPVHPRISRTTSAPWPSSPPVEPRPPAPSPPSGTSMRTPVTAPGLHARPAPPSVYLVTACAPATTSCPSVAPSAASLDLGVIP